MARAERQPPSYVSRRPVYTLSNLAIATVNQRSWPIADGPLSSAVALPLALYACLERRASRRSGIPAKVLFFTVALLLEVCLEAVMTRWRNVILAKR